MQQTGQKPLFVTGDWGELSEDDRKENQLSLQKGFRLLSSSQPGAAEHLAARKHSCAHARTS